MRVFCDNCLSEFEVSYWRLGSTYPCPVCSQSVRLDRDHVRAYATTGYEVTFSDFVRLVTEPYSQTTILPLLRTWSGFELVETTEREVQFQDRDGNLHEAFKVHASIQQNPSQQQQLYNNAMTLWH